MKRNQAGRGVLRFRPLFAELARVFGCLLLLACLAAGAERARAAEVNHPLPNEIKAGPIWNEGDAQKKCPSVCGRAGLRWNTLWRTTVWGQMSVCSCGGSAPMMMPIGAGTSCSAPANAACGGCSVACPPGKQAVCREGEDHGVTSPLCWTKAKCECQ